MNGFSDCLKVYEARPVLCFEIVPSTTNEKSSYNGHREGKGSAKTPRGKQHGPSSSLRGTVKVYTPLLLSLFIRSAQMVGVQSLMVSRGRMLSKSACLSDNVIG